MTASDRSILIIGHRQDLHVQAIAQSIENLGKRCFIIDRYSDDTLSVFSSGQHLVHFHCQEGEFFSDAVGAAWWRLKPLKLWSSENNEDAAAAEFANREWRSLLFSIPLIMKNIYWLNSFPEHLVSSYKPLQIAAAQKVGFRTPHTIFSNNPNDIRQFVSLQNRSIYKQFSNFMSSDEEFIFTNEIKQESLNGEDESLSACPGIYQPLIEKVAEWRVTLVGDRIFSVRIDSQSEDITSIDWRRSQSRPMYLLSDIDKITKDRIKLFARELNIEYGAFDFIEDSQGEMIFLECNPAGQWLWLEHSTDAKISEALARLLVSRCGASS